MESQQFLQLLKQIRKKLLISQLGYAIQLLLVYAGAFALFITTLASIIAIPYWDRFLWIGVTFLFISGGVVSYQRRATLKDSARFFDRFIEDNHVTAAYSSLYSEHALSPLVIRDALGKMIDAIPEIKRYRKRIIQPRSLIFTTVLVLLCLLIFTQRDVTFQEAKRMEKDKEIIAESTKRISNQAKKKENAAIKERLLKENEKLKKKKLARERYEEITKKVKELDLQKKTMEKQLAKLREVKKELGRLNLPDINTAIQHTDSKKLQQVFNQLSELQKNKMINTLKSQDITSMEELKELLKEAEKAEQVQQLAALQEEMQQEAEILQEAMGKSGLQDPGSSLQHTASNQNGAASSKQPNSHSKENDKTAPTKKGGQGSGTQSSTGQNGKGAGAGSGSGNGSSGNGSGSGSGAGNGAGRGQGSREMLSVPEKTGGESRVELDSGKLGEGKQGDQFKANGPVQKGSLRPYEEVYQEYYSSYRSGKDRATIPKDLEHIIESYFSEIDPGE
ncbi:hypothetical protein CN378_05145 [Bacillus sp. AFS015802]|uniref:hypothetical protein n=1 Tax=Bacillus sp. AFS015802 TaxID=2033486 RepID=UPI000BF6C915|nr:hypothetical protein [Bacillus sp. AFS015802]PFA68869.1 hypothetical protein CN378_05145 [Bacillus sp. AFS015802]